MTPDRSAGLAESARALAVYEVTSRALTEQALARIESTQATLNAFRIVRREAALAEADAADEQLAAGVRKPLLGVPVAVKDDMDVAGEPTAFGCRGEFPPVPEDGRPYADCAPPGRSSSGRPTRASSGSGLSPRGRRSARPAIRGTPFTRPGFVRWLGGGGRRGAGPGGARLGRRRFGAHPRLLDAPRRRQAAARPHLDLAARRVLPRHHGQRHPHPHGRRRGPAPGRGERQPRRGPAPPARAHPHGGGGPRPRPPAHRPLPEAAVHRTARPAATGRTGPRPRTGRHACPVGPHGRGGRSAVRPDRAGLPPRATAGIAERVREAPHPGLLDRRTLEAARLGLLLGGAPLRAARRAEAVLHDRIGAFFGMYDVVLAPTTAAPRPWLARCTT